MQLNSGCCLEHRQDNNHILFEGYMSLDKAIKYNKEHRKPYYGSKAVDPSCRNHGGCDWCEENRAYQSNKEKDRTEQMIKEENYDVRTVQE